MLSMMRLLPPRIGFPQRPYTRPIAMPAAGSVYTMISCALRNAVTRSSRSRNTPEARPHAAPTTPPRASATARACARAWRRANLIIGISSRSTARRGGRPETPGDRSYGARKAQHVGVIGWPPWAQRVSADSTAIGFPYSPSSATGQSEKTLLRDLAGFAGFETGRVVVTRIVDVGADRVGDQIEGPRDQQRLEGAGVSPVGVEPAAPVDRIDHDGHAVVNRVDGGARGLRENGARLDDLAVAGDPSAPETGERERLVVGPAQEERRARSLLRVPRVLPVPRALPLVEAIDRDEAPPGEERLAKRTRVGDGLGAGERELATDLRILRPGRHEAPPQRLELARRRPANDPHDLERPRGRHVVVRDDDRRLVEAEDLAELGWGCCERGAAAHGVASSIS